MGSRPPARDVLAAGSVVTRPGKQVLLVHRPRYDDWSFPKGKLDRGEHVTSAAVREVAEETGLDIRLGPPLPSQRYRVGARIKTVDYWMGRVVGDDDVSRYVPNSEIDEVAWVPLDKAIRLLTYSRDRELLESAGKVRKKTNALVVLRHAKARSRRAWRGEDRRRPLLKIGHDQADRLVPLLAAYGVGEVISSPSLRCVQTVAPYADATRQPIHEIASLSEEGSSGKLVRDLLGGLQERRENIVVCSHRPVLPSVCKALQVKDPDLDPGSFLVVHHRKGSVVAVERHTPRAGR